ncbi:MAG: HEPN domain-containing protein [Candidatus Aminicenantes bacterium]
MGNLSFFAVEVRYPDDFYIATEQEARECLEIARKVKEFIYKKLNITDSDILALTSGESNDEPADTEENGDLTAEDPH